ncbi:thymidine phosphorylase [soil metagenome]
MNPVEIIKHKRNGLTLTKDQIETFVNGYLEGTVAEYQMSAFLMAIYFKGFTDEETFALTEAILYSGKVIDLSFLKAPAIDKHSTGGVGDKVSLILAPVLAACGVYVPMISGRGLGHTGGTLDKLESIPGFNINYSIDDFKRILSKHGLVLIGQTSELAPADKRIYALRDVTATVENLSLITASIISKKIAEGADGIVFDVKMGNGANLPDKKESVQLAKDLISVAKKFGKKAVAVLTDMDEPLGYKIGNWLEVEECMETMEGKIIPDLYKVNNVLCGAMLYLAGKAKSVIEGESIALERLKDRTALKKFYDITEEQKGDISYLKDHKNLKRSAFSRNIVAQSNGFIEKMHAVDFGFAGIDLGCGRKKTNDIIHPLAGIILNKKCGDEIKKGELICEMYADDEKRLDHAEKRINKAVRISSIKPPERKLILDILY